MSAPPGSPPPAAPDRVAPCPLPAVAALLGIPVPAGGHGVAVTGVSLDSTRVRPGDLYAALPGTRTHGARFVPQAVAAGAAALLTDPAGATQAGAMQAGAAQAPPGAGAAGGLPLLVVPHPRERLGAVCDLVYDHPSRHLAVLGVTGTNGKTTTAYLLDAILRRAGRPTGLIGTVETRVGDHRVAGVRTTPEAPDLHALLAQMRATGVSACSMEVSSHGLALGRVDGVLFEVVAFTNLSQDHLDFHADMEDYFATKASLFTSRRARRGVVCVDDAWGVRLAERSQVPVVTVASVADPARRPADWRVLEREPTADGGGTAFTLAGPGGRTLALSVPLPGGFNVANAALAAVVALLAGVSPAAVAAGLSGAPGVPGRMQRVSPPPAGPGGQPGAAPLAVVDYAHTPDAVATALRALRPRTTGRLVVVLGAGGDRDSAKRALMGEAAARNADVVVVTDDNPRSEDPAAIRAAVLAGARRAARQAAGTRPDPVEVLEVPDRAEAIAAAVARCRDAGDTVLVAGKGHEQGQEVAGVVHPFDDAVVLGRALAAPAGRPGEERG